KMISRKLESYYSKKKSSAVRYHALSPLISSCRGLLSALAWYGNPGETEAMAAFRAGMARIQKEDLQIEAREICSLKTVDASLQQIKQASFSIKKIILDSCTACAVRDGKVTVEEAELLRAIADTLDCPVPPFLE
ncbi:MAG: Zn-dependent protease with chaperone function, partial [Candidatus Aureabacteria bacterium]|nr:Zn-dependent protease with chaperone function [Candidatus Auribacterota bacterium]